MVGEKIYEYVVAMGELVEYGTSLAAVLAGEAAPPLHGARFDASFAGEMTGRIAGHISGTDFAFMRPDGDIELNIHARIDAGQGRMIAFWADGIGRLRRDEPVFELSENVRLTTGHEEFLWVTGRQIWASGTADLATGRIALSGYMS